MFYNTFRTTKSSMRYAEQNTLSNERTNLIHQRERLLNLQKRQKLKDLLISKFLQKYGIKNYEDVLEKEITKFLKGEKLNEQDLKTLDFKIKKLIKEKASKEKLKERLTQNLQEKKPKENILPKIENRNILTESTLSPKKLLGKNNKIIITEPSYKNEAEPKRLSSSMDYHINTLKRRKYKKPEEELAELEAEFAKDENEHNKNYVRLDFSEDGDEWNAIAKYNRKLYEDQIKLEKMKDQELKRRNKADLDFQMKEKIKQENENRLKEKEYDEMSLKYQKELDELDKKKQEDIKKQLLKEKESRDEQMRLNNIKKRIELLKEKKFEKSLLNSIKEGMEKERKELIEKKIKKKNELIKSLNENNLKIIRKKEKEKQEKEEAIKMGEESIKIKIMEDNNRQKYYDMIRSYGNQLSNKSSELIEKMKKDQEEEDKRIQYYYDQKNKLEFEREEKEKLRKQKNKSELKKYLDLQIEEKKKEKEFLKLLDYEQARIWAIDCKKFNEDEKTKEKILKEMNKKNNENLLKQIQKRKDMDKNNKMNDAEYAMNRKILEEAKESLVKEK